MNKKQRMNSSYQVDYNQLMIELRKARKKEEAENNYQALMNLKQFCAKYDFTIQRIYLLNSKPMLGNNTLNKLIKAWLDVSKFIVK